MLSLKLVTAVLPFVMLWRTAIALPSADSGPRSIASRAEANTLAPPVIGIFLCDDADWEGECEHLVEATGVCIDIPNELAGKVSAIGPDGPASGCTLYQESGCKGEYLADITFPGEDDLAIAPFGGQYNDFFNSYICY